VAPWTRSLRRDWRFWRQDALAGLPGAVASVPDGMASAVLAGVNPVHGLYASFVGPAVGGLTSSTRLMVVSTTSAAALAAGSAVADLDPQHRADALFLLTILAGVVAAAAGLARLGRYTRFVSHSVMLGFLTGVAVNIMAGQIPDLTGAAAEGSFPLAKAFSVLTHPAEVVLSSLLIGLAAIAILVVLVRTRIAVISALVALLVPTLIVVLGGLDEVVRVSDAGPIPHGIPLPHLPDLGLLSLDLVAGAFAVAAIVLVQGAGVCESVPNPGGAPSDMNRDFLAQGAANLASGLFRGMPVGGSVGQTSLNASVGARTRWGAIWSGVWMLIILVAFSGVVGLVAMPTLAAILIFAAVGSVRPREIMNILRTGRVSQIAVVATFLATLFLPVAAAVGVGVALSLVLQLNQEAMDLKVVELVPHDGGRFVEHPAPRALTSNQVTVLDVYGSLFYAGARTLQAKLPDPTGTVAPAVVLRLRGRSTLGATLGAVAADYAKRLDAVGGKLYLSGLDPDLTNMVTRTGTVTLSGPVQVFHATELVGESTQNAYRDAEAWIVTHQPSPDHQEDEHNG
jgi:sulfate permease, SulP family